MRQEQNDSARPLPFRFRGNDELIDDGLRAVREIAELSFPKAKHARVIERIAVVETEDRGFGQKAVVNADARLIRRKMKQWQIRLSRLRIVKKRVPMAECAASAILPRQTHRNALQQERPESKRFSKSPIVGSA